MLKFTSISITGGQPNPGGRVGRGTELHLTANNEFSSPS